MESYQDIRNRNNTACSKAPKLGFKYVEKAGDKERECVWGGGGEGEGERIMMSRGHIRLRQEGLTYQRTSVLDIGVSLFLHLLVLTSIGSG